MKLILDCKDCGSDLEKCKCTDNIFDFTNINTPEKRLDHHNNLHTNPKYKAAWAAHRDELRKESWNSLKPFVHSYDVPSLPNPLTQFYIDKLIQLGAIPLKDLKDGQWYYGDYRNAELARWNEKDQVFDHLRYKFGYRWDTCKHFQNDDGFALFTPIRLATVDEVKTELSNVPADI
jgi:hypothetical protein